VKQQPQSKPPSGIVNGVFPLTVVSEFNSLLTDSFLLVNDDAPLLFNDCVFVFVHVLLQNFAIRGPYSDDLTRGDGVAPPKIVLGRVNLIRYPAPLGLSYSVTRCDRFHSANLFD
jgi:hypothetical protein